MTISDSHAEYRAQRTARILLPHLRFGIVNSCNDNLPLRGDYHRVAVEPSGRLRVAGCGGISHVPAAPAKDCFFSFHANTFPQGMSDVR